MEALNHQQVALDEIIARARAYYRGDWHALLIKPRWHSLLVAPTGTGKTAVATMAAETIGATLLRISAPGWMPCGATNRGVTETIKVIAEALAANDRTLLVIDEIDKISDNDNPWHGYIRGEIYELADGRWPTGLRGRIDEDDADQPTAMTKVLTKKLQSTVFMLGIGTFQGWFDSALTCRTMGFGAEMNPETEEISAEIIAQKLPRELVNRFNSSLIRLSELRPTDYHRIAKQAEYSLPERLRERFRAEVDARIQSAINDKKGVRFLEECMMEVLKNLPQPKVTMSILTKLKTFPCTQ